MAKKKWKNIIFFLVGSVIFYLVFKDYNFHNLGNELRNFKWYWLLVSIVFNISSQFIRALRWKMLIKPLGYNPPLIITFSSILIMGFTNQIIPRGGEIARLSILSRKAKIPFTNLLGTALTERLTDFIVLLILFIGLIIWQYENFLNLIQLPQIHFTKNMSKFILWIVLSIGILILIVTLTKRLKIRQRFSKKMNVIKHDISIGINSYKKLNSKFLYILYSLLIYACWLIMSYVLFFAYPPTENLGIKAAAFTYGISTMAFLLPIQAGIGAWHFVVIKCLFLFHVIESSGKVFALVAHATTNFIFLLIGPVAFILINLYHSNKKSY